MNVVIVESPAKAKTINKYLGKDFDVLASFGHVRDLPSKDGSVLPDEDFAMQWVVSKDATKRLNEIAAAVKGADKLYLATDPDREGEAISWHVLEVLAKKKVLAGVDVKRVVFHEITKSAILKAIANPRALDNELVDAYLARRALDYLVGFTLSPVLWRKLPGAKSAGRVQSVALRLICERESEIEQFKSREYWSVTADVKSEDQTFQARLHGMDGKRLGKYDLADKEQATAAKDVGKVTPHKVADVERKPVKRHPQPPFTTSTLQQEAARKLRFNAQHTMRLAQSLYEGKSINGEVTGLITYMRTDGVTVAAEAVNAARQMIANTYGDQYVPPSPRRYKSKAKNAQEAHEAIRPTDPARTPRSIASALTADELKLYELIWKRMTASQMASAELERTTITIRNSENAEFRATGTVTRFDGFLSLYQEGRDDSEEESEKRLPNVNVSQVLDLVTIKANQHFTEPLPRYSEASLVKKMEELGIGRPSTYASILTVLRDRSYVEMIRNRFVPQDKGRLVTIFLEKFFPKYVEYDFTANLEEELDHISAGDADWKTVLSNFWNDFKPKTDEILGVRNAEVIDALDEYLAPVIFPESEDGSDPRKCTQCETGRLGLKTSRYGAFIGCSNYPECGYTRPFATGENGSKDGQENEERELGTDPETGAPILLKKGRFGPYLQIGEPVEKGDKPKRATIPKDMDPLTISFDQAVALLTLPRLLGQHPETNKDITASIGRYGPYLLHDGAYARLSSTEEVFNVGLNRAVALIADAKAKKGGAKSVLKLLGTHPDDGKDVRVMDGRYGPYVNHGKINATLPKGMEPDSVTLETGLELITAKVAKAPAKKKPAKKTAAKKAPAKKTVKKAAAKK